MSDDEIREPTDAELRELTAHGMTPDVARLVAGRLHELAAADREELRRLNRWRIGTGIVTIGLCGLLGAFSLEQYDQYGGPFLGFMTAAGFTVAGVLIGYVFLRHPR